MTKSNMRELTPFEESLVELVHFLAYGKKEAGLSIREVKKFLITPLKDRKKQTPMDLISTGGDEFLNELKTFMNDMSS